jgi:hypothetical protein
MWNDTSSTTKATCTAKKNNTNTQLRHNYWVQPPPSEIVTTTNQFDTDAADPKNTPLPLDMTTTTTTTTTTTSTTTTSMDYLYAPQAQHDAVIFLRMAFDAALHNDRLVVVQPNTESN